MEKLVKKGFRRLSGSIWEIERWCLHIFITYHSLMWLLKHI